ncbi:MAG: glycosyltransferase [Bacteroidia bacterium]|nr:glycosyltransferase [Bacteroidia bacterium]
MKTIQNILICPLEWGLGHAARMIPLAVRLRGMNYNVIIGTGKEHQALFLSEIPGITCIDFPGFKPGYSKFLPQYISLLLKTPILLYHIISEHVRLRKIIRENDIDIVMSDNRFGLWNNTVITVYITHQIRIPFPRALHLFEFIGISLHRALIKRFSYCFIPDLPGELNLSGRLSHGIKLPANASYIGILSRFTDMISVPGNNPVSAPYNTVILSGPEPQRSILRKKLVTVLKNREPKTVILGGKPDKVSSMTQSENIIYYNHLPAAAMKELLAGSDTIFTRSGYTTIMELTSLNRSAILIPTPGQTEQEYLAGYLLKKGWFTCLLQKDLKDRLPDAIALNIPGSDIIPESRLLLNAALNILLKDK